MNSFLRFTVFALILLTFGAVNAQYAGPETACCPDDLDGVYHTGSDLNRFTNVKHDGFFELMIGLAYGNPKKSKPVEKVMVPAKVVVIEINENKGV